MGGIQYNDNSHCIRSAIKQKLVRSNQAYSDDVSLGLKICDLGKPRTVSLGVITAHIEAKNFA